MLKTQKEQILKRQAEVGRLYLEHSTPTSDIAAVMNVTKTTIENDLAVIKEAIVKENSKKSLTDQLSLGLAKLSIQENRLLAKAKVDSKYEKLWLENIQLQQNFLKDILSHAPPEAGETAISSLSFLELQKLVGLPKHPKTLEHMNLTPSQIEIVNLMPVVGSAIVCISKARQIGISEIILRIFLWGCFNRYKGGLIAIVAGTNSDTALALFGRFRELLNAIPQYIKSEKVGEITLTNGTRIIAGSSNPNFLRGLTKVRAVLFDEFAYFDRINQISGLSTIMPLIKSNGSDLWLCSSPNTTASAHYAVMESKSKIFKKLTITIDDGARGLYTDQEKKDILESSEEDVQQEYYCSPITDKSSYFGSLSNSDFISMEEGTYEQQ